jgi:hypothetical protein
VSETAGKGAAVFGKTFSVGGKAVPILGVVGAGIDGTARVNTLVNHWDTLPPKARASNIAFLVSDAATITALATPPPIDLIAGAVAAGGVLVSLGIDHWDDIQHAAHAVESAGEHLVDGAKHLLDKLTHHDASH